MRLANNLSIYLLITILVFFSCSTKRPPATSEYLEQQIQKIDYSDGINKEEAIILAQNYLLKNPPKPSENLAKADVDINTFDVREFNDRFNIQFDFKFDKGKPFMYPFYWVVRVDKSTGQILSSSFAGHK